MSQENPLNLDPMWQLPSYRVGNIFEQGDTVHNTYTLLYCGWQGVGAYKAYALLTSADGWPRRSPDMNKWYGRSGRCSRDALTPYLCYSAAHEGARYWGLLHTMATHGFLFANNIMRNHVYKSEAEHLAKSTPDVRWRPGFKPPDILLADIWAICLRGIGLRMPTVGKLLYPVLCLLDLHGLLSACSRKLRGRKAVSDERNSGLKHHFSATYLPTVVSVLAYRLYASTRPTEAFNSFWMQAGEPAVHEYMNRLYPD